MGVNPPRIRNLTLAAAASKPELDGAGVIALWAGARAGVSNGA